METVQDVKPAVYGMECKTAFTAGMGQVQSILLILLVLLVLLVLACFLLYSSVVLELYSVTELHVVC